MAYSTLESITESASDEAKRLISQLDRRSQPFRDRFDHTLRVLNWARRLQQIEGGDLEIITLTILFHDTGWSDSINHALVGAELAENFLLAENVDPALIERITSAARTHNLRKKTPEILPIENLIVMDADFLDEVGVTALVWDALAAAGEDNPGYRIVLQKNLEFYKWAKEKANLLQTNSGRRFYNERLQFWKQCLDHLRYELGLSNDFGV